MPAGAPKGHPRYGGRAKGTLNHATADIKTLARVHGPGIIARLVELSRDPSGPTAVAASRELLDRGYGKSPQPHDGDGQGGPITITVVTGVPRELLD